MSLRHTFLHTIFSLLEDHTFPTSEDERNLNNKLFNLINQHPQMAVHRSLDPGGMQNSLGCDGIIDFKGSFIAIECKRILTKGLNTDQNHLYKLLTTSQKITLEKCKKTKSPFFYCLYHQNKIYFVEAE